MQIKPNSGFKADLRQYWGYGFELYKEQFSKYLFNALYFFFFFVKQQRVTRLAFRMPLIIEHLKW